MRKNNLPLAVPPITTIVMLSFKKSRNYRIKYTSVIEKDNPSN